MKKIFGRVILIIIIFFSQFSFAKADVQICNSGSLSGYSQALEIPTYDYGPDGLVRFYIHINRPAYYYGHSNVTAFNFDCEYIANRHSPGVNSASLPPYEFLELRAVEDERSPGSYYFDFYNQQGEFVGRNYQMLSLPGPIVQYSFYMYMLGMVNAFTTPAVPVRNDFVVEVENPVLIIPGTLGSELYKGESKLWPDIGRMITNVGDEFMKPLAFQSNLNPLDFSITVGDLIRNPSVGQHFYDLLIHEFTNIGMEEGQNLFTFPYDWRYGISENNLDSLKDKIDSILIGKYANSKVDIVAHSTGGLLLKKYLQEYPNHRVGKAVMVGVPNTGAPKAIKALLQGDSFGVVGLSEDRMKDLSLNMPIVYELSPSQTYYDTKGSFIKLLSGIIFKKEQGLNYSESLQYLQNDRGLNAMAIERAQALHTSEFDGLDMREKGVDVYNIVGCKSSTIGVIEDFRKSDGTHGSYSIQWVPGDGTVPLESATNMPVDSSKRYFALKGEHGKMLSQDGIRQQIVNIVAGKNLDTGNAITTDINKCKLNGKAVSVYSPVNLEITDQFGNRTGFLEDESIQNDVPGASFERMETRKFLFLPDDEGQEYQVKLLGTGVGTFTMRVSAIVENNVSGVQIFHDIPVTTSLRGTMHMDGKEVLLSLDNEGDGTVEQTIYPTVILSPEAALDSIPPQTHARVSGEAGEIGYYRGSVAVDLEAADPEVEGFEHETSGILKRLYSLDGGETFYKYENPLVFSAEGSYAVTYYSVDKAGNKEAPNRIAFQIDTTAPEAVMYFDVHSGDLAVEGVDTGSGVASLSDIGNQVTISDRAGNTAVFVFSVKDKKRRATSSLLTARYNGQPAEVNINKMTLSWQRDKRGDYKFLNQKFECGIGCSVNARFRNGETSITTNDDSIVTEQVLPGLKILRFNTNHGNLSVSF